MIRQSDEAEAVQAEARKTKETAARMANGEFPAEADQTRALAGMIQQLAEQIERLAAPAEPERPARSG
ncbi:MAG TPA: hypothetical protein VID69_07835 [Actinomycetota bacterium]